MARVFVVRAAGVRLAYVVTPVGALGALAGQPQLCVFPLAGDDHCALLLSLGVELDGLVPDVLSLRWPEAAGEEQSSGLGPHGVRGMLIVRGGESDSSS